MFKDKDIFKDKDGGKKKKSVSFYLDDENLLEKYKAIWTKIKKLKNTVINALPVYDDRYIKTEIYKNRTYNDKFYINFRNLNVPEDDIECESYTVISIDSLLL